MGRRRGNGENFLWGEDMLPPEQPDTSSDDASSAIRDADDTPPAESIELNPSEVALALSRIAALLQEAGNTIGSKLSEGELSEDLLEASVLLQGLSEPLLEELGLELPARDVAVLKVAMSPQFRNNVVDVMRGAGEQLLQYVTGNELGARAIAGAQILERIPVQRIVRIDAGPERSKD